ncbi:MAG: AraC family transcriptional regulator, partial [Victivallales bacterium]
MSKTTSVNLEFIGFNHVPECDSWVDKYFNYYVIQYAERGELDLFIDGNPARRLKGPVAWLTFPGPCFKFGRRDGGTWHHRFVSFRGKLPDTYAKNGLFPLSTPVIEISEPVKFTGDFDRLLSRLALSREPVFRTIHMLEELLIQLGEQPRSMREEAKPVKSIRKVASEIENNPLLNLDWRKAAKEAGVSHPHFRRLFHETLKTPPSRFLLLKKLEMSASMLRSGGRKIEEISELCGFYDLYHF